MATIKHLLVVGACILCLPHVGIAGPRSHSISGVVEMPDGTRLRGVDVRVTNVGGKPTSDSGEFTILLPDQFEPGTEIELYVAGWRILNLYDGRTWVPKSETATIHIIVVRPGQESQVWRTKSQTGTPRSARRLER